MHCNKDFISGLTLVSLAAAFFIMSSLHPMGTVAAMGAAYFPKVLSLLLALLGAALIVNGLRNPVHFRVSRDELTALAIVIGVLTVFAVGLPRLGLFATVFLGTFVCTFAHRQISPAKGFLVAICVAAFCHLVFITGLGVRIQAWPRF